jgi:hypothetical protein
MTGERFAGRHELSRQHALAGSPAMRRTAILSLGAALCALALAGPASAQVQPAGTGEPLYTNSTQNTPGFEWSGSQAFDAYRIRFDYYVNNALTANPTVTAPKTAGSMWANWSGVAPLQHGGQYGVCAQGQYRFPNDAMWFPDGPNSCSMGTTLGRRGYTTIDRSKPCGHPARDRRRLRQGRQGAGACRLLRRRRRPVPGELPVLHGRPLV